MKTIARKFTWKEYEEDIKPFLGYSDDSPIKKWVVAPNYGDVVGDIGYVVGDIITNSDKSLCCCFVNETEKPIHIKPEEFLINETVFEEGDIISHIHGHYILIYGKKTTFGFSTIASISSNNGKKWDFDVEICAEMNESEFCLSTDEQTQLLMKHIDDNGYDYNSVSHKIISREDEYCVLRDSEPSERVCLEMTVVKCYDKGLNDLYISSTYGDENFDKDINDVYIKSVWAVVIYGKLVKHTDFSPLTINKKLTKLEDGTVLVDKTNGRMFVYSHSRDKHKLPMEFDTNKLWFVADYTITKGFWCNVSPNEPYDLTFNDTFRRENLEIARPYEVDAIYNAIIRRGYCADKDGNKIINIRYNCDNRI